MFSKLQTSVKQFFASITNTQPVSPINLQKKADKIFFPTFESKSSILFWLLWVVFFALYGIAVQAHEIMGFHHFSLLFLDYLLQNFFVIFFNIGFTYFSIPKLVGKTHSQISTYILINSVILTPSAIVLANFILHLWIDKPFIGAVIIMYAFIATLVIGVVLGLLCYYFSSYEKKIQRQYELYQDALIEQNEQIKARITPHFFFNMLNTVQYLVEENPYEAENMLRSVSNLYRASFNGSQEIGFLDEIEICKHYLNIEMYRFAEKLEVIWQLPDEDMLYDMTIPSLTLQLTIEKMIIFVVENTNSFICLEIAVDWEDDIINIDVKANLLGGFSDTLQQHIREKLSFHNQIHILQDIYGKSANITYQFDDDTLTTKISYPFFDVAFNQ